MSQHHGQPARYVKCTLCGKPVKRYASQLKRKRFTFCSRACANRMLRLFAAHCQREAERMNPGLYANLPSRDSAKAA